MAVTATQVVFRLPSKGSEYSSIVCNTEPIPTPQRHEVLLQIHATTLNYRDLVIANGQYPFPAKDNVVPCSDAAGIVIAVGDAVGGEVNEGDWGIINFDISNL